MPCLFRWFAHSSKNCGFVGLFFGAVLRLPITVGAMSSSGLETKNFQIMTKDNKQHELSDSTDTAIAYSTCYVQCGDNLELLKSQPNESVNMIYCDILYGTGRNFGDYQDLKPIRNEIENHYLPRLIEMKRVLKQNGSIYLQMDTRINHWIRCLMDDVFGYSNFRNEIIWAYRSGGKTKKTFSSKHDIIYWYSKSENYTFNIEQLYIPNKNGGSYKKVKNGVEYNYDKSLPIDWRVS